MFSRGILPNFFTGINLNFTGMIFVKFHGQIFLFTGIFLRFFKLFHGYDFDFHGQNKHWRGVLITNERGCSLQRRGCAYYQAGGCAHYTVGVCSLARRGWCSLARRGVLIIKEGNAHHQVVGWHKFKKKHSLMFFFYKYLDPHFQEKNRYGEKILNYANSVG